MFFGTPCISCLCIYICYESWEEIIIIEAYTETPFHRRPRRPSHRRPHGSLRLKTWCLQRQYWVCDEKLGVSKENLGVSDKSLVFPIKIESSKIKSLRSPKKTRGLRSKPWGLQKNKRSAIISFRPPK